MSELLLLGVSLFGDSPDSLDPHPQGTSAAIGAVVDAHPLTTKKTNRGSSIVRSAGCACDPNLELAWSEREVQHQVHLFAAIFEAGRASDAPTA